MVENLFVVAFTVISGVVVFVLSEILKEIWLSPLQEYKLLKSKISNSLTLYTMNFFDWVDLMQGGKNKVHFTNDEASKKFLFLAAELSGLIESLGIFKFGIPSKKKLIVASKTLRSISFAVLDENNIPDEDDRYDYFNKKYDIICKNLKLYRTREESKNGFQI
jgi:hypothetical protein